MYNFGYCCNLITALSFYFKGPYSYSIKKKKILCLFPATLVTKFLQLSKVKYFIIIRVCCNSKEVSYLGTLVVDGVVKSGTDRSVFFACLDEHFLNQIVFVNKLTNLNSDSLSPS